jgi:hypothetical protein
VVDLAYDDPALEPALPACLDLPEVRGAERNVVDPVRKAQPDRDRGREVLGELLVV